TTQINLAASNTTGITTDAIDATGNQYTLNPAPTNSGTVKVLASTSLPPLGTWSGDPVSKTNVSPLTLPTSTPDNPVGIGTMLLLTDGTVMADGGSNGTSQDWYRLTPDVNGDYAKGTWSPLASMSTQRLFFGSVVLKDGRVLVYGGEYTGLNSAGPAQT